MYMVLDINVIIISHADGRSKSKGETQYESNILGTIVCYIN